MPKHPQDALTYLQEVCIPGQGEVQATLENPALKHLTTALGSTAAQTVLLSPGPNVAVHNPVTHAVQPGDIYRSVMDPRSFSLALEDVGAGTDTPTSLTVKGGDLPVARQYPDNQLFSLAKRVREGQIPGAGVLKGSLHEFEAAVSLQTRALELLGRPTFTALPHCVREIKFVENRHGEMVPVSEYMDSDEYLDAARVGATVGLGTLLVTEGGLRPSEYWYGTRGLKLSVDCLVNARHFAEPDIPGGNLHENKPPVKAGYKIQGDVLPRTATRKNDVFRTVYHALGKAYGFDPAAVLPKRPITDETYMRDRRKIRKECERLGIPDLVLPTFISRVTEVAALVHSQEITLAAIPRLGGSFVPRNVTHEGTVLDLDTYGQFGGNWQGQVGQDIEELVASVALLGNMISPARDPDAVVGAVTNSYIAHLEQFGTNPKLQARLIGALGAIDLNPYLGLRR